MDRRKFLALASGGLVGLAGCSGFKQGESPVRDQDATPENSSAGSEGEDGPTRLGIRDIGFDGRDLVVRVSDSMNVTDHVEIQSENGQGATISISGREARKQIVDPRNAGREDVQPIGIGPVTVLLYDEEGSVVDEATFEYNPELTLSVRSAAGSVYQESADPKASALFTFSNSGVGPTYLESFEVREPQHTLPLTEPDAYGDEQTTLVQTGEAEGLDSDLFEPVGIGEDDEELFLPQGAPLAFGADGIFAHTGPAPEPTDTFEQVFTVTATTGFGREFVFDVTVEFSGGLTEASIETASDSTAYRFENFEATVERIQSPQR